MGFAASGFLTGNVVAQQEGTLKWAFTTLATSQPGAVESSAAIGADGTIYVGIEVGDSTSSVTNGRLYAIKPNGSLKWSVLLPDWVSNAPAIGADGTIYVGSWDGVLRAYRDDGTSGTLLWGRPTLGFITGAPAVGPDGVIYIGSGDGEMHAVNPDGSERWSVPTADWVESSPSFGPDGTIYFGSWDESLYAVSPSGVIRWTYPTGGEIVDSPAIAADGTIYFGSRDGGVYALTPSGQLVSGWPYYTADVVESSPAIGADGTIYVGSADGYLYAINPDGTLKWRYDAGDGIYGGILVRSDGAIIFGGDDYAIHALNPDGTQRWEYASTSQGPFDWVDAAPAMASDGTLYLGSWDKRIYAINGGGITGLAASAWPAYRRDLRRTGAASLDGLLVYDSWAFDAGLSADDNAQAADPDADGQPNLAEFLFGGSPLASDAGTAPKLSVQDGAALGAGAEAGKHYLVLTARVRHIHPGVTLTPEAGASLEDLADEGSAALAADTAGTVSIDNDFDQVTCFAKTALEDSGAGRAFLRLRLLLSP